MASRDERRRGGGPGQGRRRAGHPMAFEVLLAELRRQVQRRRGGPAPVAVPYPRLIRLVLAPWQTFRAWRELVLRITAIEHTVAAGTTVIASPDRAGLSVLLGELVRYGQGGRVPDPGRAPSGRAGPCRSGWRIRSR
jgi:hypothetical protein